jgi:hypothetical protein
MSCTLSLGGQCCNDLNDIVSFIQDLQTLDLHDAGRQQCCKGGNTVDADCECPENSTYQDPTKTCLWDYCMTYDDIKDTMQYYQGGYNAKQPEQLLVGYILALYGYMGSGNTMPNAVDTFAADAGAVLDTLLGLTTACYVAYNIITSAVNVNATGTDRYKDYGVYGPLGAFIGVFQGLWVITFLGYTAAIALAPVKLALDFNSKGTSQNDALFYHTLQSISAYIGYYTITEAKTELFGVWDNGAMDPDYGDSVNNTIALTWDILNHTIVAIGYSFVSIAVALGPFMYAEFGLDNSQFPGWMQSYAL